MSNAKNVAGLLSAGLGTSGLPALLHRLAPLNLNVY